MSDGSLEWTSVAEYGALGGGPWACFQAPKDFLNPMRMIDIWGVDSAHLLRPTAIAGCFDSAHVLIDTVDDALLEFFR